MIGQMMNYDVKDRVQKDNLVKQFVREVDPYKKPAGLGIDLRALSSYAEEKQVHIRDLTEEEIAGFKL